MQIALDTVVYILLSLMLFSLVLSFLPKVEEMAYAFTKPQLKVSKEDAIQKIIDIYLDKEEPQTILLEEEIDRDYVQQQLENAGLNIDEFQLNFNSSTTLSIIKANGEVIING